MVFESRDVGYLCANFSLPRPLCSRLRLDVRDRQTSDRRQVALPLLLIPCYFVFLLLSRNVFCILYFARHSKVIEKSIWITLKKCNLYFVIEIHFKSNWSNSDSKSWGGSLRVGSDDLEWPLTRVSRSLHVWCIATVPSYPMGPAGPGPGPPSLRGPQNSGCVNFFISWLTVYFSLAK